MKALASRIAFWFTLAASGLAPVAALAQGSDPGPNPNPPTGPGTDIDIAPGGDTSQFFGMDSWVAILVVIGLVLLVAVIAMAMSSRSDTHVHH
jgi:hypothetical protein